jgi:hypothetical protein
MRLDGCSRTSRRAPALPGLRRWSGPEDPGTPASRPNDRLVVVTQGELAAEIAARAAPVPAPAVIFIPADVPHHLWNSSSAPARYLDADVPAPQAYTRLAPAR